MIKVNDEGIILRPTDNEFERSAVFNPACIEKNGIVHMFYRALNSQKVSSIGLCKLVDNKVIERLDHPVLFPEFDYEKQGLEDPRIIFLEGIYYLFYTAYDGENALVSYATSNDLTSFKKMGVVTPRITYDEAEDLFRYAKVRERYRLFEAYLKDLEEKNVLLFEKDACLFPKKINGRFSLLHRIQPGIQVVFFDDFAQLTIDFWRGHLKKLGSFVIMDPLYPFESLKMGMGCPPIETPEGWLLINHGVEDTPDGNVYHASAALLDLENPLKVLARLKEPLFSPKERWEREGLVNNVVFPTGAIVKGDTLFIYYGAADTVIGAKSLSLSELLRELKKNPVVP